MKATPVFNENEKIEKSYHYDGENYAVQNGKVFKLIEDEGYLYTDEITISQLEIYGEELIEKPSSEKIQNVSDPIVGTYFCSRTHDTYVFKSDKTGFFTIQGGVSPSEFTWKRSGNNVTIVYEAFGEQKLKFDQRAKTITEKSESFGTLVFNMQ